MGGIRIGIVGVGNCASALVQGIAYYRHRDSSQSIGLMHWDIGGYEPSDIEVVAAFDIDRRKVGRDVAEAIFALPNCTTVFEPNVADTGTIVKMGRVLDGVAEHMMLYDDRYRFVLADGPEATKDAIVGHLDASGCEMLLNYLPVGSERAC